MAKQATHPHCRVEIRLKTDQTPETPICWIFDAPARPILLELVSLHAESIIEQLEIAIATVDNQPLLILRVQPTAQHPPILPFVHCQYQPFFKWQNVVVPVGMKLTPALRRDIWRDYCVRSHLFTWFTVSDSQIVCHQIPQTAFEPLHAWIEYTVTHPIKRHIGKSLACLQFEPFQVIEASVEKKPSVVSKKPSMLSTIGTLSSKVITAIKGIVPKAAPLEPLAIEPIVQPTVTPGEIDQQIREVERLFIDSQLPLDDPQRRTWWERLAVLYHRADTADQANICWQFAIWEDPSTEKFQRWISSVPSVSLKTLETICQKREPTFAELWQLILGIGQSIDQPRSAVEGLLSQIVLTLEKHDDRLPIRAAWHAAWLTYRLSGHDALALIRHRDRLLHDVMEHGIRRDRDFPIFMQNPNSPTAGNNQSRTTVFKQLSELARNWCPAAMRLPLNSPATSKRSSKAKPTEDAIVFATFVDLTFAIGMARSGDIEAAETVRIHAERRWIRPRPDQVDAYNWIFKAYVERCKQACRGEHGTDPLPIQLRDDLAKLNSRERQTADRFLQFSRILEPLERVDPFRHSRVNQDSLTKQLNELQSHQVKTRRRGQQANMTDEQLELTFRELLKQTGTPQQKLKILSVAIPMSVRIGESFGIQCLIELQLILPKLNLPIDVQDISDRMSVLETASLLAAHLGKPQLIPVLIAEISALINRQRGELGAIYAKAMGGGNYRFLARAGFRQVAKDLLDQTAKSFMQSQSIAEVMSRRALNREVYVPAFAKLAAGWFYFDDQDLAKEAIEVVRQQLFTSTFRAEVNAQLAQAYAFALAMAPQELALAHYTEIFNKLELSTISFETMAIQRLMVIEAIVVSIATDDFASHSKTRRWIDEDEYLVRRRIHRDVEAARLKAGL